MEGSEENRMRQFMFIQSGGKRLTKDSPRRRSRGAVMRVAAKQAMEAGQLSASRV